MQVFVKIICNCALFICMIDIQIYYLYIYTLFYSATYVQSPASIFNQLKDWQYFGSCSNLRCIHVYDNNYMGFFSNRRKRKTRQKTKSRNQRERRDKKKLVICSSIFVHIFIICSIDNPGDFYTINWQANLAVTFE